MTKRSEHRPPGFYLYGVVRTPASELDVPDVRGLEVMREGPIAAVIRRVPLREFAPSELERRFRDRVWLERAVRAHNAVIEQIHQGRPMLPAKFGAVYTRAEDVTAALRSEQARLVDALDRVEGRDEWVVHLKVTAEALARAVAPADEDIAAPERRPGHAYFQDRRRERDRARALETARSALADAAYDALARHADDGRATPAEQVVFADDEAEVLRAAFLVRRGVVDAFLAGMHLFATDRPGTRWEYSGPLPPYSFAAGTEEDAA